MKNRPFEVPVLDPFEKDIQKIDLVIEKIKSAEAVMTFIKSSPTRYEFLFSDFGNREFAMLLILFGQNPQAFEFFKKAIINTELYNNDGDLGFQYTQSVEYIQTHKSE